MTIIILAVFLICIAFGFLLEALFLYLTTKIFKIEATTYKKAIKVSIYFWLISILAALIIGVLFSIIKIEFLGNIIAIIAGFFIANSLYKKYYQTDIKKNIKIYITKMLFSVAASIIIALGVIFPIRLYIFQPFFVQGVAMEPNFHNNEYTFIKIYDKNYQRGDVVAHKYPKDTTKYFMKRIIGLPGEKVEIKNEVVFINDKILNEPYLSKDIKTTGDINIALGGNEYFVMGDNRMFSSDSRFWGSVNKNLIVGKYWITLYK